MVLLFEAALRHMRRAAVSLEGGRVGRGQPRAESRRRHRRRAAGHAGSFARAGAVPAALRRLHLRRRSPDRGRRNQEPGRGARGGAGLRPHRGRVLESRGPAAGPGAATAGEIVARKPVRPDAPAPGDAIEAALRELAARLEAHEVIEAAAAAQRLGDAVNAANAASSARIDEVTRARLAPLLRALYGAGGEVQRQAGGDAGQLRNRQTRAPRVPQRRIAERHAHLGQALAVHDRAGRGRDAAPLPERGPRPVDRAARRRHRLARRHGRAAGSRGRAA